MKNLCAALGLLLAVATVSSVCWSAEERIPTVTRTVKIFTELESAISASIQRGDAAALQKALSDDFELRAGAQPGTPTPREEWVRSLLAKPLAPTRIEQMAVHDMGDVAVVSFLETATGKRDPARDIFVVDVWKRAGDTWRLAIRYASAAGTRPVSIPGDASSMPRIPKKY
jgi:ketosteroid isomerase-like protein